MNKLLASNQLGTSSKQVMNQSQTSPEQEVKNSLELLERKILNSVGKSVKGWIITIDENSGKVGFSEHIIELHV